MKFRFLTKKNVQIRLSFRLTYRWYSRDVVVIRIFHSRNIRQISRLVTWIADLCHPIKQDCYIQIILKRVKTYKSAFKMVIRLQEKFDIPHHRRSEIGDAPNFCANCRVSDSHYCQWKNLQIYFSIYKSITFKTMDSYLIRINLPERAPACRVRALA